MKVLEEEGLDTDGAVESTSKLRSQVLATSGVDILTDTGAYKSTYQILLEIAEVWDKITDDKARAGLLELLAGKRNSSVIAALLQNPEQLKAAYEDANNASGSALKENEKYLDSIQGKIDQFNNAVQTLWSNALDSDVVKDIVELGTWLIKVIDKVGLLNSVLITLATISMVKNKQGPIAFLQGISDMITGVASKVKGYATSAMSMVAANTAMAQSTELTTVSSLKNALATAKVDMANKNAILSSLGLTNADKAQAISRDALTASTISTMVAEGQLTQAQANTIMSLLGISAASNEVNAARMNELLMTTSLTSAQRGQIITQLGLSGSLKKLSADEVMNALTSAGMAKADAEAIMAKLGLTAANKGLAASFMTLWTAMWPILAVMAGAAIIWGIVKGVDALIKTTEELQEELDGLKSELSDIRSELDSVNSELETTNERMTELLAKDKLTFEEQEELDRLRETNDELERRKTLLEDEEENKAGLVGRKAARIVNKTRSETLDDGWRFSIYSAEDDILNKIEKYQETKNKFDNASSLKEQEKYQKKLDKQSETIDEYITTLSEALDGVEYGDSEESDAALDYLAELQDTYGIARGSAGAKTNAIKSLFNKDEFSETKTAIDGYVSALAKGDANAKNSIANIIKSNKDLVQDLEVRGLEAQDAIDYFTKIGSEANYATIDGKVKEIDEATKRLNNALGNVDTSSIDSIKQALTDKGWVDKDGKVLSDEIAEYFGGENGGVSEQTRVEIERLVKQIYDGKISVQDALKSFELFGVQSIIEIQIEEVKTNFKDVFVDLENADGLINTFEELGTAIGSTVGALEAFNQAQADVADKGFVSIQTALQLMEYTDDYGSVLEVVDGKLQLAANAEQNLIQARIDAIKVSAQTAVADAQAAYDKAELAVQSYRSAMVEEASASTVATAWQKIVAVAAGIKNALENIWSGESIGDLYNAGYNTYLEKATGYKTSYDDAGLQALEDALAESKKALDEAKGNAEIANAMTAENLDGLYKSSDKKTKEEVEKDKLDKIMEDFQDDMDYWENRIGANQARYEQLQNEIDLLEAKGQKANAEYYNEQIKLENKRLDLLNAQKTEAKKYLTGFYNKDGEWVEALKEGSEEWF